MTFEAWLKDEKFKSQVALPFKEYLKAAFCKHSYLHVRYHYLLSIADNDPARRAMARAQEALKADRDTTLSSSAQGSGSTDHNMTSSRPTAGKHHGDTCPDALPPSHPTNEDGVENPTETGDSDAQKRLAWSWLSELNKTSNSRPRPNPDHADDAEYRAEDEEDAEMGAADTSRTKSARISKQGKRPKFTRNDM
jgi:hypothetical protein